MCCFFSTWILMVLASDVHHEPSRDFLVRGGEYGAAELIARFPI
jgi:hypothetical protein